MSNFITIKDHRVVMLADYPIDMMQAQDGIVYFGASSIRLASIANPDWARNALSVLMGIALGIQSEDVVVEFGNSIESTISRSCLLTKSEFSKCLFDIIENKEADFKDVSSTQAKRLLESQIQDRLSKQLGCRKEVSCPYGRVDLLSDDLLVEIKNAVAWKSAVGQLLVYSSYFPNRRNIIYLFNVPKKFNLYAVKETCFGLGIEVVIEGDRIL